MTNKVTYKTTYHRTQGRTPVRVPYVDPITRTQRMGSVIDDTSAYSRNAAAAREFYANKYGKTLHIPPGTKAHMARIVGLSPLGRFTVAGVGALGAAASFLEFAGMVGDMPFFQSETTLDPSALTVGQTIGEWTVESVQDLPMTQSESTQTFYYPRTKGDGVAYSPSPATTNAHYNLTTQSAAETKYDQWTATPYLSSRAGAYIVRATEKRVTATGNPYIPYDYFFGSAASLSRATPGTAPLSLSSTQFQTLPRNFPKTTPRGQYNVHPQPRTLAPPSGIPPYGRVAVQLDGNWAPARRDGSKKITGRGIMILAYIARQMGNSIEWLEVLSDAMGFSEDLHRFFANDYDATTVWGRRAEHILEGKGEFNWERFFRSLAKKVAEDQLGRLVFANAVEGARQLGITTSYSITGPLA